MKLNVNNTWGWLVLCHLDWTMWCPDIWLNIILGVSLTVVSRWDKNLNCWTVTLRLSSPFEWVPSKQLKIWTEQSGVNEDSSALTASKLICVFWLWTWLEPRASTFLPLRPLDSAWSCTISTTDSQAHTLWILLLSCLHYTMSQFLTFICSLGSVSLSNIN